SVATMVQVSQAANDVRPTGTITSPASDVTISAGQSVAYSGTGNDPDGTISGYSWSFPGGNPSSSNLANPGNVTYATPGTYVTTFTVTDNVGLTDPHPPTRTITVQPDFSLSASPSSRTVVQGGGTSFTATVTAGTGFSGTVSLSVNGLPAGASASFNPASISTSGSSTLSVTAGSTTAPGSYPLTITATSGALSHTANVTLVVSADFSACYVPLYTLSSSGHKSNCLQGGEACTFRAEIFFAISEQAPSLEQLRPRCAAGRLPGRPKRRYGVTPYPCHNRRMALPPRTLSFSIATRILTARRKKFSACCANPPP